ncbi:MAG: Uma2 family endonuclease [Caldilineaceae bacterium]
MTLSTNVTQQEEIETPPTSAFYANGHTDTGKIADYADESEDGRAVSEEEYWATYYEHPYFSYEWNNGILEEKPVSDFHNVMIYQWFVRLLEEYLAHHPVAVMVNLEMGFRLRLPKKTTIRKPDLFLVRHDNPITLALADHTFRGICDLCVEILSDSTKKEKERDTVVKKAEYATIGVHEYYILDDDVANLAFYRRNRQGDYEAMDLGAERIVRSAVLDGFQFRVDDLLRRPALIDLVHDDVYRHFVNLDYQVAQQVAQQERQRAEEERQRATFEYTRAERYAALLREHGISLQDPDTQE